MSDSSDADLLRIFWVEVNDYLQALNKAVLQIETNTDADRTPELREMNRMAHSMKGAARAVGITLIETIAHYMEEIFEAALLRKLDLSADVCDLLYDGLDVIQNVVRGEETVTETLAEVLARFEQTTAAAHFAPQKPDLPADTRYPAPPANDPKRQTVEMGVSSTLILRQAEESIRVTVPRLDRLMGEVSELLVARMHAEERQRDIRRIQKTHSKWQREWRSIRAAYIRLARRLQSQDEGIAEEIAVLFRFLETNQRYLMESNRQLNQLAQHMAQHNSQLNTIAEQIQDDVSGLRLVPFESVLNAFQRMVRDLARDTDKRIHLDVIGATVEMDKTVLDALTEPIMHLLRNAVDHGLERPAEREAMGKPATGRIVLALEQRGGEITLKVSDDGRGINPSGLRYAAVQAGMLTTQEAALLPDEQTFDLIFHPGFTTSQRLTTLSGRGVGMDIVRTRVESLRGRVGIQSDPGEGTIISLTIPLSLTRISAVLLRVGDQDFAVQSSTVMRMAKQSRSEVFTAEGREMIIIQEQPMPLVSLRAALDMMADIVPDHDEMTLLVLRNADRVVAFEVDELYSEQELVLKPLGREIAHAPYISGAALLGDGSIIIMLDANDLIRSASGLNLPRTYRPRERSEPAALPRRQRILVVDDSITTRTLEKNILETAGYEVYVAIDGVEAWAMLGESRFDMVIADVEMPNMNGLELARRIKGDPRTYTTPIILLTSLGKPEQRAAGLQAGADAYLIKSRFDQNELLRTIQAYM